MIATVCIAVFVWMPYQKELGVARKIASPHVTLQWSYCGPIWIPQSAWDRLPFFYRINFVGLDGQPSLPPLSELGSLTSLGSVCLNGNQFTDASLEQLKGLTDLVVLNLSATKVTDGGLEQLNKLANLKEVRLDNTAVASAGLLHLKGFTNLMELHLSVTQATDEGLEYVRGLNYPTSLDITYSQVAAEWREMLQKALPRFKIRTAP